MSGRTPLQAAICLMVGVQEHRCITLLPRCDSPGRGDNPSRSKGCIRALAHQALGKQLIFRPYLHSGTSVHRIYLGGGKGVTPVTSLFSSWLTYIPGLCVSINGLVLIIIMQWSGNGCWPPRLQAQSHLQEMQRDLQPDGMHWPPTVAFCFSHISNGDGPDRTRAKQRLSTNEPLKKTVKRLLWVLSATLIMLLTLI